MNLNELTLVQAIDGLKNKQFSSVELTRACLKRIQERDGEINAFITVTPELALAAAAEADTMLSGAHATALTGIPFAVKDAICTAGVRSTGSAKILDNYTPPFDATVIARLRSQGAVLLGKNNCDAFGHGASNENSMYGPVRNPHGTDYVAGGSSGGSAAAVADHMCIFSIAEDTGGSIRQPASFCGAVGLRPSYGRNSRFGIMPMASSFDTVGPITKTVADAALVMQAIAGPDPLDATTANAAVPDFSAFNTGDKSLRIGIPREYLAVAGLDSEVKQKMTTTIDRLEQAGYQIEEVSLPHTKYAIAVYYIVVPSEDSSNLGRLDGIRYGTRAAASTLLDTYSLSRTQGFPEEVKRRILIGTYVLSAGYYDAYYQKAEKVRTLIKQDFTKVFERVDVLLTPTSPFPAFKIGEKAADPMSLYLADVMVSPSAVAGVPGLSVPIGKNSQGLPIGAQIIGPALGEVNVLRLGQIIQDLAIV